MGWRCACSYPRNANRAVQSGAQTLAQKKEIKKKKKNKTLRATQGCSEALHTVTLLRTIWLSSGERAGWLKNTIKVELARSAHPGGINKRAHSFYVTHLSSPSIFYSEIYFCPLPATGKILLSVCPAITHSRRVYSGCWSVTFSLLNLKKH